MLTLITFILKFILQTQYSVISPFNDHAFRIHIQEKDELGKKKSDDRYIIIVGTPENCCKAQREISELLQAAFERDMSRITQLMVGIFVLCHSFYSYIRKAC